MRSWFLHLFSRVPAVCPAVWLCVCLLLPQPLFSGQTIVPEWSRIADRDARLELARLLSLHPDRLSEAATHYRLLYSEDSTDARIILGLGMVLARLDEHHQALKLLRGVQAESLTEPEHRLELADLLSSLGHARDSRNLIMDLAARHPEDPVLGLRLANRMLAWGDFYRAETLLREALAQSAQHSDQQRAVRQELAANLMAAQRHEQAEGVLRELLLDNPADTEAVLALIRLRILEQNTADALILLDAVSGSAPGDEPDQALLRLRGQILRLSGDLEAALAVQKRVVARGEYSAEDEVVLAGTMLRLDLENQAEAVLESVLERNPEHAEARFLWLSMMPERSMDEPRKGSLSDSLDDVRGHGVVMRPEFVEQLRRTAKSPGQLVQWGEFFRRAGAHSQALHCFEAALEMDAEHFPARLALAETSATLRDFQRSIAELEALLQDLPDVSKLLLTRARVLSWSERYAEALAAYDALHQLRPDDPVPLREAARVAMWAKQAGQAENLYQALQVSGTLENLLPQVEALRLQVVSPKLREVLAELAQELGEGRAFPMYVTVAETVAAQRRTLSPEQARALDELLVDLLPAYRIQQSAHLEQQAKMLAWNRRFVPALAAYEHLVLVQPGNQEALFDLAQAQCVRGLHDRELDTCRRILNLDPLHGRAGEAVERINLRSRPGIRSNFGYWHEQGQGGARLSAMERRQADLTAELPLRTARYHLFATGHSWSERPGLLDDLPAGDLRDDLSNDYSAQGLSMGLRGVINPWLRGHLSYTRKNYDASRLGSRDLGRVGLELDLRGLAGLGLEYERMEELSNGLALTRGIMSHNWRVKTVSPLSRRVDIGLYAELKEMSDANRGLHLRTDLGVALTDHPRELKVVLAADHRHFRRESDYSYDGPNLVDIRHPYWTPRNHSAGTVTLQWRHDLAELFFCGARQHVYLLKLSAGTDTDGNPGVRLEGEYLYDFAQRWNLKLQGLVHRSRQWNAEGLWLGLEYRF